MNSLHQAPQMASLHRSRYLGAGRFLQEAEQPESCAVLPDSPFEFHFLLLGHRFLFALSFAVFSGICTEGGGRLALSLLNGRPYSLNSGDAGHSDGRGGEG